MADLSLRVLTPAETILDAPDVAWVQVELVDGRLGIWPGHAPLLAETAGAPLHYADSTGQHTLELDAGILQIERGRVTIFTGGQSPAKPERPAAGRKARFERLTQTLLAQLGGPGEGILADGE